MAAIGLAGKARRGGLSVLFSKHNGIGDTALAEAIRPDSQEGNPP